MCASRLGLVLAVASLCSIDVQAESPYAGQETRDIKALSAERIEGYLSGAGMGYAKAAELNGYPGPKHVLELADKLNLSDAQRIQTEQLFESMRERAAVLGKQFVEAERRLDQAFASGEIDGEHLTHLLQQAAYLESEIRYAHLSAHLKQVDILDQTQRALYAQLRGYHGAHQHAH